MQYATDTASQYIVGADVTGRGNDYGEMPAVLYALAHNLARSMAFSQVVIS